MRATVFFLSCLVVASLGMMNDMPDANLHKVYRDKKMTAESVLAQIKQNVVPEDDPVYKHWMEECAGKHECFEDYDCQFWDAHGEDAETGTCWADHC